MTKSKSTRHSPAPTTSSTLKEDIPLSEQIRLAQASGILPAGSLQHPSSIRNRKATKQPLVDRIPAKVDGAKIEEINLGEELEEHGRAESAGHYDQYDEDDDEDDNDDDRPDIELDPTGPWNPQNAENVTKIPTGIKRPPPGREDTPELDLSDEIFITIMYLIPLASLYLLFDLLAHMSFNRNPGPMQYIRRLTTAVPTIGILVFLTNRYQAHPLTAPLLMLSSFGCGCRLFWLMNESPWTIVMKQAAPVVTLWILSVVQLPFGRLMISLVAVAVWYWWNGYELTLSLT